MIEKIGSRTIKFSKKPSVLGYGSVVGKKEHEGPLSTEFDAFYDDSRFAEKTFEKAESRMQKIALETAFNKSGLCENDMDIIFAGDLLNQCISSSFSLREKQIPFVGLYGACSTMTLALINSAVFVESGAAKYAAAVTSSHFCTAERQYRFPLEYGSQRTPTSQWTATAAGADIIGIGENKPYIEYATVGKIVDLGVKDANNMGAAMAPAAADTIISYFKDTNTSPEDYDMIFTGDLGKVGSDLLYELTEREGIDLRCRHSDCGLILFDREKQDVHAGASGCGCSAAVLNSYVFHRMENGTFKNILFMSTGALLSPTSTMQGESIPSIAHLVNIRM